MSYLLRNPTADTQVVACTSQSGVAAGEGDNTELTSAAIDLRPTGTTGYDAAQFVAAYKTSLTAAATLKLTLKIAESDDGTNFGSDTTLVNASTLETGAATNKDGVYRLDLAAHAKKRYIRLKVTMDLSAGATDTFVYGSCVVLQSPDKLPAA